MSKWAAHCTLEIHLKHMQDIRAVCVKVFVAHWILASDSPETQHRSSVSQNVCNTRSETLFSGHSTDVGKNTQSCCVSEIRVYMDVSVLGEHNKVTQWVILVSEAKNRFRILTQTWAKLRKQGFVWIVGRRDWNLGRKGFYESLTLTRALVNVCVSQNTASFLHLGKRVPFYLCTDHGLSTDWCLCVARPYRGYGKSSV